MVINNLKTLKDQFIEQTFSKKWRNKYFNKKKNFTDDDLLEYCSRKAWKDATLYVKYDKNNEILKNAEKIKEYLLKEIKEEKYIKNFDDWHNNLCQNTDNGMRYGVWQKYINVFFKYLYCINDSLDKPIAIDFNNCHLPLDDNCLLWCRKNGITEQKTWNDISKEEYIKIRDDVREYLKNNTSLKNALEIDFVVWRAKKICDVLNNVINLKEDYTGLDGYKDWFKDCGYDIKDKDKVKSVTKEMEKLIDYINK